MKGKVETLQTDIIVIGGGAVGLAVTAQIPEQYSTILIEKNAQFGQETSSRNSEVVHSGIYYPKESIKTAYCIKGRELLYSYCEQNAIAHKRCGKVVVATTEEEEAYLNQLAAHCEELGVPKDFLSKTALKQSIELVEARLGLYFPMTGIIDSHAFMASLEKRVLAKGGMLAYRHEVSLATFEKGVWNVNIVTPSGNLRVQAKCVVNAAGLAAAEISNKALDSARYEHRFCRGRYFVLSHLFHQKFPYLVYPVPQKDGLGVHVTVDLNGYARLGPDVEWCDGVKYSEVGELYDCNWDALRPLFTRAAQKYCPSVQDAHLAPGLIGVRPKLFIDGKPHPDFLIESHVGFIHCLGVESPGLTSALAIAEDVVAKIEETL